MPNSIPTMTLYLRRTTGSFMAGSVPAGRLVTITPVTASATASAVPTASGITSQDGASAWPQPNHAKAKNPSMATVTPRLRPLGNTRCPP
jgi:hypothetical protein